MFGIEDLNATGVADKPPLDSLGSQEHLATLSYRDITC